MVCGHYASDHSHAQKLLRDGEISFRVRDSNLLPTDPESHALPTEPPRPTKTKKKQKILWQIKIIAINKYYRDISKKSIFFLRYRYDTIYRYRTRYIDNSIYRLITTTNHQQNTALEIMLCKLNLRSFFKLELLHRIIAKASSVLRIVITCFKGVFKRRCVLILSLYGSCGWDNNYFLVPAYGGEIAAWPL